MPPDKPGGKAPPGKIVSEWGDDPRTRREQPRLRVQPLTDQELWEAIRTHFPAELVPLAAATLSKLIEAKREAEKGRQSRKRRSPGRPPGGAGAAVEELMGEPLKWDQTMARTLVARRRGMSVAEVGELHRDWLKRSKKDGV